MATEVSFAKTFLAILDKHPQKITADHVEDPRNYPVSTPYTLPRLSTFKAMSKPGSSSSAKQQQDSTATTTAASSSSSSAEPSVTTVTIKSPRNPTLEITLPTALPTATTSMLDIKHAVHEQTCLPVEKLKILYNKKPVADTKTIKDVLGSEEAAGGDNRRVEFSLMVMGGAATARAAEEALAVKKAASQAKMEEEPEVEVVAEDADGDTVMTDEQQQQQTPVVVVAEGSGPSGAAVLETEEFWEDLRGFLTQRIRDEKVAGEVVGKFRGAV